MAKPTESDPAIDRAEAKERILSEAEPPRKRGRPKGSKTRPKEADPLPIKGLSDSLSAAHRVLILVGAHVAKRDPAAMLGLDETCAALGDASALAVKASLAEMDDDLPPSRVAWIVYGVSALGVLGAIYFLPRKDPPAQKAPEPVLAAGSGVSS